MESVDIDLPRAGRALLDLMAAAGNFRAAAARHAELNGTDATALATLGRLGSLTPRALAGELRLSTPTMTALIDRLERAELVRREPNPGDRRSVLVVLTESTAERVHEAGRRMEEIVAGMPDLSGLASTLVELSRRVNEAADEVHRYVGPLAPDAVAG